MTPPPGYRATRSRPARPVSAAHLNQMPRANSSCAAICRRTVCRDELGRIWTPGMSGRHVLNGKRAVNSADASARMPTIAAPPAPHDDRQPETRLTTSHTDTLPQGLWPARGQRRARRSLGAPQGGATWGLSNAGAGDVVLLVIYVFALNPPPDPGTTVTATSRAPVRPAGRSGRETGDVVIEAMVAGRGDRARRPARDARGVQAFLERSPRAARRRRD